MVVLMNNCFIDSKVLYKLFEHRNCQAKLKYSQYVNNKLTAFILKNYRTKRQRSYRSIRSLKRSISLPFKMTTGEKEKP